MSGFTTTGATVMGEISTDRHSHALLMWRQLTQWLGGMGIIVLMIAILPEVAVNGAQPMASEAPGPELQKLTPTLLWHRLLVGVRQFTSVSRRNSLTEFMHVPAG